MSLFQVRNENQHSVSSGNNYWPIFIMMCGTITGRNRNLEFTESESGRCTEVATLLTLAALLKQ